MKSKAQKISQPNFHYVRLADEIEAKIMKGDYRTGEKLPSLRKLHQQLGLSISTVYQSYIELEKRGAVESRSKSGFYIKPASLKVLPLPRLRRHRSVPKRVRISDMADDIVTAMSDPAVINFGGAAPDPKILAGKSLARLVKTLPGNEMIRLLAHYESPSGHLGLKRQIAGRTLGLWSGVAAEDVVITNGCLEAVGLCLRAIAGPGDTVLVESPTFHGFLQLIEDLNMYALEVPAHPDKGIDMALLRKAVTENKVKCCLLIPNFQNPMGAVIPDERKEDLVRFLGKKGIPIIEDDIYGDLYFGKRRPLPLISFDRKGLVLYCSSFSKSLAPGLRLGWTLPGRFLDAVKRVKLNMNLGSAGLGQFVISSFIKSGSYDRHLRRLRNALKVQMANMAHAIARHFPEGTKVTAPQGGLLLWLQLDRRIESMTLYRLAWAKGISILPGAICASSGTYKNCIRLNCGQPYDQRIEKGIAELGRLVGQMTAGT